MMRKLIIISALLLVGIGESFCQNIYDSIYVGNRWRTYMTHLPTGYIPTVKYPLVFCFHGGQNGAASSQLGWQAISYMSNMTQKSNSAGFILVYPEGAVINNNRTWNAGDCCQPATTNNIDDVGFVSRLIDTLVRDYSVDTSRVYASGSSNGAMLCFRLACEIPQKIAAIATISATQTFSPCNPIRRVPIINFHSKVDIAVPYGGGIGQGPSGTVYTSQDSTMNLWQAKNNCISRDTLVNGYDTNYTFIRIHNCSCNVEFDQYNTSDGGHSWPSGNPNNNPVSYQVDATELLWNFFQRYQLGCSKGTYKFTGNGNWTDTTNWQNKIMPPPIVPNGDSIIINPVTNGQSILNTSQTLSEGSHLQVNAGKKLIIPGQLQLFSDNPSVQFTVNIFIDGIARSFIIYLPTGYNNAGLMPMLFAIHGGSGTPEGMMLIANFKPVADREKIVLVYPAGIDNNWNDGRPTTSNQMGINDVSFFNQVCDYMIANYAIDSTKIYATGISNGGFMSSRLGCELARRIAAIAVVAATIEATSIAPSCNPSKPVPAIYIHGTLDGFVPFIGGQMTAGGTAGGTVLSHFQSIDKWISLNGCSTIPIVTDVPDLANDGTTIKKRLYTNPVTNTEVISYVVTGGGHTWPQGYQYLPEVVIGKTSQDMNACEEIWNFFKRFTRN